MANWREVERRYRDVWTGRGQGVATDGVSWFVTQNDKTPGVSRYSADFSTLEARAEIPRSLTGHVGAVSLHDGVLSIALEKPEAVITFDRELRQLSYVRINRPIENDETPHLAWCAVNPANGLLYTCNWIGAVALDAYDLVTGEPRPDANIALAETMHRVQGGDFSSNGLCYLAADDRLNLREWLRFVLRVEKPMRELFPGIHCFDAATGDKLDYRRVPVSFWPPFLKEIEGVAVGPMLVNGVTTHVHLTYLVKNHTVVRDAVWLKSFVVPSQIGDESGGQPLV